MKNELKAAAGVASEVTSVAVVVVTKGKINPKNKKIKGTDGWGIGIMAFSDWLIIGAFGMFVKKGLESAAEEKVQREREYRQYEEERKKCKAESTRRDDIDTKRKNTPCKFKDGLTYEDFSTIAHKAGKRIKRIKDVTIIGTVIYCTVESQTGYSDWDFREDFNDWGHVTGTYWKCTENCDSNIPKYFGDMVSEDIHQLFREKNIHIPEVSEYVDENEELGTPSGLSYIQKIGFFKKVFSQEKQIISRYDSQNLVGEHIYLVVSLLKSNGYKNIKSISIKDVDRNSDKYIFEVEQVVVNGTSFFEVGNSFPENVEVIISYHIKQEIAIPYAMSFFRKKNLTAVGDQLQDMGFSNIHERKIKDLVTGWLTKYSSVDQVLVKDGDVEVPINKNQPYEFDTEIVITYHTFSK